MGDSPLKNVSTLQSRLLGWIWSHDVSIDPWWKAAFFVALRTIYVVVRDLADGQLTLRSMSLVYTTLLSIVPMFAISFSVLKGFGVRNQIEPLLYSFLEPLGPKGGEIAVQIVSFVENVKVGVLGSFGLVLLLYTAISLMQKIERAFNQTWHVTQQRRLAQRFSDYLSVIFVGPVLIFSSLAISAALLSADVVGQFVHIAPIGAALALAGRVVPFLLSVVAFTFIYIFITNTKVRVGSALVGAVGATLLWKIVGWVFTSFIVTSGKYEAIYSGFATLIFFLIWLYFSWLILLIGSAVAFYHQHPEYLTYQHGERRLSGRVKEKLALLFMKLVADNFYGRKAPWTADGLAVRAGAPMEATTLVLDGLEAAGLLTRAGDNASQYVPARPLDTLAVAEVVEAVRAADEGGYVTLSDLRDNVLVDRLQGEIGGAVSSALDGRMVKDLVGDEQKTQVTELHPRDGASDGA